MKKRIKNIKTTDLDLNPLSNTVYIQEPHRGYHHCLTKEKHPVIRDHIAICPATGE